MSEEWISITEAAQRLSDAGDPVDRSTLSRYLKQHAEALPLRRAGKSNLVDFLALVAHRGENIRLRTPPPSAPAPATTAAPQSRRFVGTQTDGAARKMMADAELREIALAKERKQLAPVGEVDRAGRDAVALMQSAFEQAVETDAAAFALKYGWDERQVRLALKQFARRGLDRFNAELRDRLEEMRRADQEEPAEPAPA
ncbi:hypothetical protein [Xanthobacter flavus]|uniref:hypothetical protein n=1 Tax=Xanthobacter flavus TaxID=281 RepID=UPI001AE9997E|nr:hypothetical protein [Xanthobacter flavus]